MFRIIFTLGRSAEDPFFFLTSDPFYCSLQEYFFYHTNMQLLGDPDITANLYCNFAYLYWEVCSIYLL